MILALALACSSSGERTWEPLGDPRYPQPPVHPDGLVALVPTSDAEDGTSTPTGFLPDGRDGVNVATADHAVVLRFPAAPPAEFARLVLPVAVGHHAQDVRITAEIDGRRSVGEVRWRNPAPWPDPWQGAPRRQARAPQVCAALERTTPDLAPLLAEIGERPVVLRLEAVGGSLGILDSTTTDDPECPGRLAPILEVAPSLRATLGGKELLGRPTDRAVTLSVFPWVDVEVAVEIGGVLRDWQPAPGGRATEIPIDGLSPDTAYTWRLHVRRGERVEVGPPQTFSTARPAGRPFTFAVTADGHFLNLETRRGFSSMHLLAATYAAIGAGEPDFVLDLGDSFNSESYRSFDAPDAEESLRRHLAVRPYFERAGAPFFAVIGNHEGEQGWQHALRPIATAARNQVYPNPAPDTFYAGNDRHRDARDYYAFSWGDALIVVLDPYRYTRVKPHGIDGAKGSGDRWDWTLGEAQYRWLARVLEGSSARWKLVFSHQVTGGTNDYGRGGREAARGFEWGATGADLAAHRPGWDRPIHRVLADARVTAFIHGHDHLFAFEPPLDGVAYVTAPQPGDARYEAGHKERTGLAADAVVLPNTGFLRFAVAPDALTLEYVRTRLPGDGAEREVAFTHTFR